MYQANVAYQVSQSENYSACSETLHNMVAIKVNDWKNVEEDKLANNMMKYLKFFSCPVKYSAIFVSIASSLQVITTICVMIIASYLVLTKQMSVGYIFSLTGMVSYLIAPLFFFIELISGYPEVRASYDRIIELYNQEDQVYGLEVIDSSIKKLDVTVNNFTYDTKQILTCFKQTFEKGNIYFIVGSNGAGKSTLLKICAGLYHQFDGNIKVNDHYLYTNLKQSSMSKFITYIQQQPSLFIGTIEDNLFYGTEQVWDDNTDNLFFDFNQSLKKLPEGLLTKLTDQGNNLSGGEKQKIEILRGLLKNSDIILLDEPTNSLDKKSANFLFHILTQLKQEKIIIMVTHNKEYFQYADQIISL
jgi:ATP-binding cassette subfamily C protein